MKPLSETRAPDRKKMAQIVVDICKDVGVEWSINEDCEPGDHSIYITGHRGLCVRVQFRKKSWQPNVYVLSWHMEPESKARLNNATFGGDVNPYHMCKATYVANGFDELQHKLRIGLELAKSGKAFL